MTTVNTEETLEVLLKEYPEQLRMLRHAEYQAPNTLIARLWASPGWAVKSDDPNVVNHFTATESVLSHNQMAYVLTSCMAQAGAFEGLAPISLDAMNRKKFNKMLITEYNVRFRKPFSSTEEYTAKFTVEDHRVKRSESGIYIFTRHDMTFMGDKAYGSSKGAIQLDPEERTVELQSASYES
jgi:hypothetical protein